MPKMKSRTNWLTSILSRNLNQVLSIFTRLKKSQLFRMHFFQAWKMLFKASSKTTKDSRTFQGHKQRMICSITSTSQLRFSQGRKTDICRLPYSIPSSKSSSLNTLGLSVELNAKNCIRRFHLRSRMLKQLRIKRAS